MRTYSELIKLKTFRERFEYLKLGGKIGDETFGYDRYLNQVLYKSSKWKETRAKIILRDNGFDLGCEDRPINGIILIHHINPVDPKLILDRDPIIFDSENLISVSHQTHNAIHYGDETLIFDRIIERTKNDTIPWRR